MNPLSLHRSSRPLSICLQLQLQPQRTLTRTLFLQTRKLVVLSVVVLAAVLNTVKRPTKRTKTTVPAVSLHAGTLRAALEVAITSVIVV
jgi:hypothetical protein